MLWWMISCIKNAEHKKTALYLQEALKLHVVDSLRAPVCQPQTTPEAHLQPPADSPEQGNT